MSRCHLREVTEIMGRYVDCKSNMEPCGGIVCLVRGTWACADSVAHASQVACCAILGP